MPAVATILGLRVMIYPNDHRPAHVHVIGGGLEAIFDLHCPDGPLEVRENYGFSRSDVRRLKAALHREIVALCENWSLIHGQF
jgi:hypothetical protein